VLTALGLMRLQSLTEYCAYSIGPYEAAKFDGILCLQHWATLRLQSLTEYCAYSIGPHEATKFDGILCFQYWVS
jgi:hypothetical protein